MNPLQQIAAAMAPGDGLLLGADLVVTRVVREDADDLSVLDLHAQLAERAVHFVHSSTEFGLVVSGAETGDGN